MYRCDVCEIWLKIQKRYLGTDREIKLKHIFDGVQSTGKTELFQRRVQRQEFVNKEKSIIRL